MSLSRGASRTAAICFASFLLIALLCPTFSPGPAEAGETTLFGPAKYVRTNGAPNVYQASFQAAAAPGRLTIRNGAPGDHHRVTSAWVSINGQTIFGPSHFKKQIPFLEAPVELGPDNNLRVELASKPGTYLIVEILQDHAPIEVTLTAAPESIVQGESASLTWTSANAASVEINQGVGQVDPNGSITVSPTETTTYTITATGPGGTTSANVTITVIPLPTATIAADPETIIAGQSATLTWQSEHADTITIEPSIGAVDQSGSISVSPTDTTVYTITAAGPGGTASATITITVIPLPTASLTADPETIIAGQSATLSWQSEHADSVTIEPAIGPVDPSGAISVSPADTTVYTITAAGPGGSTSANVTITVIPLPTASLTAQPETIIAGQSATLSWNSENADTVTIEPNIGAVDPSGSISVSPTDTTVYTITAAGPGGTASATLTITVIPLPTASLTADPETIIAGNSSTLTWQSEHADMVTIEPAIGPVDPSGAISVSPADTTVYTITAAGPGGSTSANVTITVIPLPTASLTAQPETIIAGQSATLSWNSENADTVTIEPNIGAVDPSGSISVSPTETTVYTITAAGPGGSTSATVTITVIPVPTVSLSIVPQSITRGQSTLLSWQSENADSVTIDQGVGAVGPSGSMGVAPLDTVTYTVTAIGPGGAATASAKVTVTIPEPVITFAIDPPVIVHGQTANLTWQAEYTDVVEIDPAVGLAEVSGSHPISPAETTTFTAVAFGPGGIDAAEATVTVVPFPTATLAADPNVILPGESVNLTWTSTNADSVTIEPGLGPVDPNGAAAVNPTETTVYTLTATGPGGEISAETTVTVTDSHADLAPIHIDLSGVIVDDKTLQIAGPALLDVVNHTGGPILAEYEVLLFEDLNRTEAYEPGQDRVLGRSAVPTGPQGAETLTVPVDIASEVLFKDNRVFALVDTNNTIRESDEMNNVTHSVYDCEYHPPVGTFNPVLEWSWTGSSVNPTSKQVMSAPIVANLSDDNGDGRVDRNDISDIVFNTFIGGGYTSNGTLRAISGDGSGELFSITAYRSMPSATPAAADIDGDGFTEILMIADNRKVVAFENDGTFKWISPTAASLSPTGPFLSSVTIADIDTDGSPEIIVGHTVFNSDGTEKWVGVSGTPDSNAIVANLDMEGHPEVIIGNTAFRANGDLYWQQVELLNDFTAVADFDEDPFPEVVLVGSGKIYLLEHDGQIKWGPVTIPGSNGRGGHPTVADFDGDGQPEIGVAGASLYCVFETNGTLKWQKGISDGSSSCTGSTVFDFEGDGRAEVVYADEKNLYIINGENGLVLFSTRIGSATLLEYPLIVDVDNDNNAEIIVVSGYSGFSVIPGIHVFGDANDSWVNTRKIWNQYSYHITNVNDDGTIPRVEANNWETFNNYRQNQMLRANGCTDLSASYLRVDNSAWPTAVALTARIGNGGVFHLPAGVEAAFYNGDPAAGGVLIGTAQTPDRLHPGQFVDLTLEWTGAPEGFKDVYVRVDDDGTGQGAVAESSETNNLTSSRFHVGNQPPLAAAGPDQSVLWGSKVFLDGRGSSDADGDTIVYKWSVVLKPGGSTAFLANAAAAAPFFIADQPGTYVLELIVSDGTESSDPDSVTVTAEAVTVPGLAGLHQTEAESALIAAGLAIGAPAHASDPAVPAAYVISQNPAAGEPVQAGTPVSLTISLGPVMTVVPQIAGLDQSAAPAVLAAAALVPGAVTSDFNASVPENVVIRQFPGAGSSVPEGSAVDYAVSLGKWEGPDEVTPNVDLAITPASPVIGQAVTITVTAWDNVGVTSLRLWIAGQEVPLEAGQAGAGQAVFVPQAQGVYQVEAEALDDADNIGAATDSFNVPGPDVDAPSINISITPPAPAVNQPVTVTVTASDNVGVTSLNLTINGQETPLEAGQAGSGQAVFTPTAQGHYHLEAEATDEAGNVGTKTASFTAADPSDNKAPAVGISAPMDGGEITAPTDVIGTVYDAGLSDYRLEYSRRGENDWTALATGSASVTNAAIGRFDPTLLANGLYDLRLVASDFNGNEAAYLRTFLVEGELKVGINKVAFTDLEIPVSGINLSVVRAYDSGDKRAKDFGHGWSLAIGDVDLRENRTPGDDWYEVNVGSFLPKWEIRSDKAHMVAVTYPDGKTEVFDLKAEYVDPVFRTGSEVRLKYAPRYGTHSTLEAQGVDFVYFNGNKLEDLDAGRAVNPARYRLKKRDGTVLTINEADGLERIDEPNGNRVEIDAGGITHSTGKNIVFLRDTHNRIDRIVGPDGHELVYDYDQNGDLISLTDALDRTSTYTYDADHNLTEIHDPRGIRALKAEYDPTGRLIATIDANGNRIAMDHDLSSYTSLITDRRGFQTLYTYDEQGRVLSQRDHQGATTSYTYDDRGNKLTETDPLGRTTTYTYDANDNVLSETDPLGNRTQYTYYNLNRITGITDPKGARATATYDAKGNLLTVTDALTNVSALTYISGRPATYTDAEGHTTTFHWDAYGNLLDFTDPLGAKTRYTYDSNGRRLSESVNRTADGGPVTMLYTYEYDDSGRLIKTTDPDGLETRTEYNLAGLVAAEIDEKGRRTEFTYDDAGNLIRTDFPDGTAVTYGYDEEGNRISRTDQSSRITTFEYDHLNRLVRTNHPDGGVEETIYDTAGQVQRRIDPNGHATEFRYDAASRLTSAIDALGYETSFGYDFNGNRTSITDALSHTTTFEYDAENRHVRTVYPDGTSRSFGYDKVDWLTFEADQNSLTTRFLRDALGRLVKVIDAKGGETSYDYDEVGNRVSQTDPNNHATTWAYDNFGQETKRTLPVGMSENFNYDDTGNLADHTDFNGAKVTYTYDNMDRLTGVYYPGGASVIYAYTPTGQVDTVTDHRGVTSYDYDSMDRPTRIDNPDGTFIEYAYDLAGNRTSITTPYGTTQYTYDALNRLNTVTDPDYRTTTYVYDAAGNLLSVNYPNGTHAEYTNDNLNRVTKIEHQTAVGTIFASYDYTHDPAGNRTGVVEFNGRRVNYTYDELYRLLTEEILDPNDGGQTIGYTYDPFGNRLTKTDPSGTITYQYDENDRLLSESGPLGATSYVYDQNGNTVGKSNSSLTTEYTWDYENRLTAIDTATEAVTYAYDAYGNRVTKSVNGQATNYLVDLNQRYAQVLAETDAAGNLQTEYIHGNDLIEQVRSSVPSFYHYDAQLSTRHLTNQAGVTTDAYTYDAFGRILNQTGPTENNYRYTGEQYDPHAEAYYLRARYYHQSIGRFLSTDIFPGFAANPSTRHRYTYTENNPANLFDFSGLTTTQEQTTTVGIQNTLVRSCVKYLKPLHEVADNLGVYDHVLGNYSIVIDVIDFVSGDPTALLKLSKKLGPEAAKNLIAFYRKVSDPKYATKLLPVPSVNQLTGQLHHGISKKVHKALERHPRLKGNYQSRDLRFVAQAKDKASHSGYQGWHRDLDKEVATWIDTHPNATINDFENYLQGRYSLPDLLTKFPMGL